MYSRINVASHTQLGYSDAQSLPNTNNISTHSNPTSCKIFIVFCYFDIQWLTDSCLCASTPQQHDTLRIFFNINCIFFVISTVKCPLIWFFDSSIFSEMLAELHFREPLFGVGLTNVHKDKLTHNFPQLVRSVHNTS